jgi:DNA repair photolyase
VDDPPEPRPIAIRGRGAASNPPNRFERLARIDDEPGAPATELYRDTSRTIIATNDSPDVGFSASINPYRGCEHGCAYCLEGRTPVLLADGTTRSIAELRPGDEIYGTKRAGAYRRYVRTKVLAHWATTKPAYKVTLDDGTELIASGDHRFLTERGWKHVTPSDMPRTQRPHLTVDNWLMGIGSFAGPPVENANYRRGYLSGMIRDDGLGTAISRKRDIEGQAVKSSARLGVRAIEKVSDAMTLFDITTGTGDFIANGVVSHNCYARPTHEYLGFSAGLDFETKIFVKEDAAALLRRELADPRWQPQTLSMSGVTDPYQPVERRLQITRQCLEVLVEFRNPVCFVTKSHLITRDADLIGELARFDAAAAILSITTLDRDLARRLEPRAATPDLRLDALRCLSEAGVPTGVMVAPIIPGLTDHEVPAILAAAADAGARVAGYTIVRLPLAVAPLFETWLDEHAPGRKQKVLNRLRAMRGGRLNDPRMGNRMRGEGAFAAQIDQLFRLGLKRAGLTTDFPSLSTAHFRRPGQLALFE